MNSNIKVALCPMAGITDSAFRLMNKLGGADIVYSEMAHVNAISYNSKTTLEMLKASPFEFPYVVQLFGKDPQYFAKATKIISERGVPVIRYEPLSDEQMEFIKRIVHSEQCTVNSAQKFLNSFFKLEKKLKTDNCTLRTGNCLPSGLDINLGCPAKKVFGHGGGAALWKDLKNLRAILEAVINNTKLPVSIKVRTGVGDVTLIDLLDHIKDLPIKRIMVHGRTYTQGFSGPIDTKLIKKVIKAYPQFEFWVNGGITDALSAQEIIKKTGCANLGIARGTYGNPLLAQEIKSSCQSAVPSYQKAKSTPLNTEHWPLGTSCLIAYIHSVLAFQSKGPHGIVEMRKHLAWYFKDFPGAKDWRKKLVTVKNLKEIEKIISKIMSSVI